MSFRDIDLHAALKKYFGFGQFKGLQEEVPVVANHYVTSYLHY